ncbi:hemolysin III family protein [Clostridium sp.]|jgi:hemolysin III|uniref:PAQR family membrane homeostasis protein TrhA n=1 Tax=Clostridium sp. TaxID=1506 RepID=UPI0025C234C6|nr:hemolysin III family protein [Clostridium sp.]MCI9069374.1 hemolysin III family protein [Clostridium sp.]MCI9304630.1 hemolysin III family protein [Clostridium sp.]
MYKKLREPINSITHLAGALFSLIALIAMLIKAISTNASSVGILSVTIFGISLILLYITSGTYHGIISSDKVISIFKKLDHSMIFVLIAGSYAPFCLLTIGGKFGVTMFIIMITLAVLGIIFKLCWFTCPCWVDSTMYIGLGWAALFMIKPLASILPAISLFLLVLGGIFYTIGGVIYASKSKKLTIGNWGFHEIFHIFILLGSLSHFICVYTYVI